MNEWIIEVDDAPLDSCLDELTELLAFDGPGFRRAARQLLLSFNQSVHQFFRVDSGPTPPRAGKYPMRIEPSEALVELVAAVRALKGNFTDGHRDLLLDGER